MYHKDVTPCVFGEVSVRWPHLADLGAVCPAGSCTVRWENKTMYCIVSAFGLSI